VARFLASASAVAAIQLGTPTDCGRRYYSSAFLVIEHSSAPVIEPAGGRLALGIMTVFEAIPSECVIDEGHAAECEHRGHGYEFHGSLLDLLS
jgi:hypothetical protein